MQKSISLKLSGLQFLRLQLARTGKTAILTSLILLLFSALANATNFDKDFVVVNGTYYQTLKDVGLPNFRNAYLGSFDRNRDKLALGGEANTISSFVNGAYDNVYTPQMYYRVYKRGSTPGRFAALNLDFVSADGSGSYKKWSNTTSISNLLGSASGAGSYELEIYFQAHVTYSNSGGSGAFEIYDSNSNQNYTASFDVTGTEAAYWTGNQDNSWATGGNWSTGMAPDANTDVVIPYQGITRFPVLIGSRYDARSLTLLGDNATATATISLQAGELLVHGDFRDAYGGFKQSGGVFTLAGADQVFDGDTFYEVHIQGGGTKFLSVNPDAPGTSSTRASTRMDITSKLVFVTGSGGGVISTSLNNPGSNGVNLYALATITGEDENSYVQGILSTTRQVDQYTDFGGIGIELTPTVIGSTIVLNRFTGPSSSYNGVGIKGVSINRSFSFIPQNFNSQNYTLVFHYLNVELNGNTAANLGFYTSPPSSSAFTKLGRTFNNPSTKTVTLTQITSALNATFTLGEINPLPVTLISFTATPTAQGAALLRWATATESNNRGFGIERQLGASGAWQSVGFVAAGATTGSTYEYTDKSLINAPASTQAYYRLRQEDLDAKVTYSPVAIINRMAAVAATELTLSPVPVSGADVLSVGLAEAGQAGIAVTVINTQGQRLMSFTTQASSDSALSLPVTNLAAGVYIVTVQVPGQAARHARFVKL